MYDALLEDCDKYAKVAKKAVRKMQKIEEENKYTLVQLKEAKYEVEEPKEELLNAYSKIKFLELEKIQANFYERPRKKVPQKRDSGTFLGHLSFRVSGMESPHFFYIKKKINT